MKLFYVMMLVVAAGCLNAQTIFKDGKSDYVIQLKADAIPTEKTAAAELQEHIRLMGDVKLSIVNQVPAGKKAIRIAANPQLEADAVVLKLQEDGTLLIGGGSPRGVLYAVYTLLEDYAQVRWWTPTAARIEKRAEWTLPELNYTYTPAFKVREVFYLPVRKNEAFAARMRNNGHFNEISAAYGGHQPILEFCHTFNKIIPSTLFKTHPEYFAEIDGKRSLGIDVGQPCLSNPEVLEMVKKKVLEWLRVNPGTSIVAVSQNDNSDYCRCAKCAALDNAEGTPAASIINFVNQVADAVAVEFPNVWVETLAYMYTQKAPKTIKPRDNMIIRLCSFKVNYAQPLDSDANAAFRDDIRDWARLSKRLYIWNYVINFSDYFSPFPSIRHFGQDLRFMAANRVEAVFEQGTGLNELSDMMELRQWLLSQLIWNPEHDQEALTDEFLEGYYGAAAPYVKQYLEIGYQMADTAKPDMRCNGARTWFIPEDLLRMKEAFNSAEAAVKDDPVLLDRVQVASIPVNFAIINRNELKDRIDQLKLLSDSWAIYQRHAYGNAWREHHGNIPQRFFLLNGQLTGNWNLGKERPEICKGLADDQWAVFDNTMFKLFGAKNIDDNGTKAVQLPQSVDWALQLPIPQFREGACRWQVYGVLRCDSTVAQGSAGTIGLHPNKGIKQQIPIEKYKGANYQLLDLGVFDLNPGGYFYVTGQNNQSTLYFKEFIMIRK